MLLGFDHNMDGATCEVYRDRAERAAVSRAVYLFTPIIYYSILLKMLIASFHADLQLFSFMCVIDTYI